MRPQPPAASSTPRRSRSLHLRTRFGKGKPGAAPGITARDLEKLPPSTEKIDITCIDYSPDQVQTSAIDDLDSFLAQHRPAWSHVRWINIDGVSNPQLIYKLASKYDLHPLAIEDVMQVGQRPKVEPYSRDADQKARLFIIVRMLQMNDNHVISEQVSMFLGHSTLLTFQETKGDVWDNIRTRINTQGSRIRLNDASFLAYCLIDAIVDFCFPILEYYGDHIEDLEDDVLEDPNPKIVGKIHGLKRELLLLRRAVWPMREVVHSLQREPHECMSQTTQTYLRDVYDHAVQIIDIIETYREVATGLTETYMTSISNRMNQIMKVLTIMGTIFIPLTFLAGVYGMNFKDIPELNWRWAYPTFWAICVAVAGGMFAWFKRRGWI